MHLHALYLVGSIIRITLSKLLHLMKTLENCFELQLQKIKLNVFSENQNKCFKSLIDVYYISFINFPIEIKQWYYTSFKFNISWTVQDMPMLCEQSPTVPSCTLILKKYFDWQRSLHSQKYFLHGYYIWSLSLYDNKRLVLFRYFGDVVITWVIVINALKLS